MFKKMDKFDCFLVGYLVGGFLGVFIHSYLTNTI